MWGVKFAQMTLHPGVAHKETVGDSFNLSYNFTLNYSLNEEERAARISNDHSPQFPIKINQWENCINSIFLYLLLKQKVSILTHF